MKLKKRKIFILLLIITFMCLAFITINFFYTALTNRYKEIPFYEYSEIDIFSSTQFNLSIKEQFENSYGDLLTVYSHNDSAEVIVWEIDRLNKNSNCKFYVVNDTEIKHDYHSEYLGVMPSTNKLYQFESKIEIDTVGKKQMTIKISKNSTIEHVENYANSLLIKGIIHELSLTTNPNDNEFIIKNFNELNPFLILIFNRNSKTYCLISGVETHEFIIQLNKKINGA